MNIFLGPQPYAPFTQSSIEFIIPVLILILEASNYIIFCFHDFMNFEKKKILGTLESTVDAKLNQSLSSM
jgi:hypothetical protein